MNKIERLLLQVKEMKWLFLMPLVVYYALFPLLIYGYVKNPFARIDQITVLYDISYTFVPILAVWWIFLFLREIVEGNGREILLLGGGVTSMLGLFYVLHSICMLPIFLFFDNTNDVITTLYLQMVIITFFMYGLAYLLCVLLKNVAIPILLVLIYSIFSTSSFEMLTHFKYGILKDTTDWLSYGMIFLIVGIVFWCVGHVKVRSYR